MKSNQTFKIVEYVSWPEENEKEGKNKYTKWENSAAWIISNLLLKPKTCQKYSLFVDILAEFLK